MGQELGVLFAPFMTQTAEALLPVFEFSLDEGIRDLAFETWGLLCETARNGGQADVLGRLVQEFLQRVLPKFDGVTGSEASSVDEEMLKTVASGITSCLKKAGPNVLSAEQVKHICQVALATLSCSLEIRNGRELKERAQPVDEESSPEQDVDEDGIKLRLACCEMVGSLMCQNPDAFVSECFFSCMQVVDKFIEASVRWEDRRMAVFLVCDMLEHLRDRIVQHWGKFMPQLLQDVIHQSAALRQPACYAVCWAAREAAFAPLAVSFAQNLAQVVTQARNSKSKKAGKPAQACADNALAALLEILNTHGQALGGGEAELWTVWLGGLPCRVDDEVGVINHKALLRLAQAENVHIVGENAVKLPQVLSILVDVYGEDFVDEDTTKGIGQFILQLGQQRLEQLATQLREKQRKKLLRIHQKAQAH